MFSTKEEQAAFAAVVARFPSTFKLKGHNGVFRISESSSYMTGPAMGDRSAATIMLYTQCAYLTSSGRTHFVLATQDEVNRNEVFWSDFAKGTVSELQAQVDAPLCLACGRMGHPSRECPTRVPASSSHEAEMLKRLASGDRIQFQLVAKPVRDLLLTRGDAVYDETGLFLKAGAK